jgi:hypothetical protein
MCPTVSAAMELTSLQCHGQEFRARARSWIHQGCEAELNGCPFMQNTRSRGRVAREGKLDVPWELCGSGQITQLFWPQCALLYNGHPLGKKSLTGVLLHVDTSLAHPTCTESPFFWSHGGGGSSGIVNKHS